jgi:hypothetical protein
LYEDSGLLNGDYVTTQKVVKKEAVELNNDKKFVLENGTVSMKPKDPAVQGIANGIHKKRAKKTPVIEQPVTTTQPKPKVDYWHTEKGLKYRIRMISGMLDGTFRKDGVKTIDPEKLKEAKKKIAQLQKELKELGQ